MVVCQKIFNLFNNLQLSLAFIGISFTWAIFRINQWTTRSSLLSSLYLELQIVGRWFKGSYDDSSSNRNWYYPLHMVVGLKRIIVIPSLMSGDKSNLFTKELIRNLGYLNAGIERFQQHLERYLSFVTSTPTLTAKACKELDKIGFIIKLPDGSSVGVPEETIKSNIQKALEGNGPLSQDVAIFLERVYDLNKNLHKDGIADNSDYRDLINGQPFPRPHKSFLMTLNSFERERKIPPCFFPSLFVLIDVLLLLLAVWSLLGIYYSLFP